jgi:hypothetical protein
VKASPTNYLTQDEVLSNPTLVIRGVSDSLKYSETNKFYEIIPGGLREHAFAYVDLPSQDWKWHGVTEHGIPPHLLGADYVKVFANDKWVSDAEISVTIARPAKLYIFFDSRILIPDWLKKDFRKTKDLIRMGQYTGSFVPGSKDGPPKKYSIPFHVWERIVNVPGIVKLGPNTGVTKGSSMYGIAAVAINPE